MTAIGTIQADTAQGELPSFDKGSTKLPHADLPLSAPERKPYRRNWRAAWHHIREFKKDKENTREIFSFFDSLPWVDVDKRVEEFLATPHGQRVYETEPFLPDFLDDHEALRRDYAPGSLAHYYCDYMESEGLSAAGLKAESDEARPEITRINDKIEWYNDRLRDTHDLVHILSGIGRDTLGEGAVGAWVYGQRPSLGHLMMGLAATVTIKAHVTTKAPVVRSFLNAKAMGKSCKPIAEESIRDLLALTLEEAREKLGVKRASRYEECIDIWKEEGVNPHAVLAKEDPSAGTRPPKGKNKGFMLQR